MRDTRPDTAGPGRARDRGLNQSAESACRLCYAYFTGFSYSGCDVAVATLSVCLNPDTAKNGGAVPAKGDIMAATSNIIDLAERLPTTEEMESAAEAAAALARARNGNGSLAIPIAGEGEVRLAPAIADIIIELLGVLARNKMVTIVPTGAELTTQQAADMLNVSRPYISKLLKEGKIDHVRVGSHRRVPLAALMAYKAERDAGRRNALRELARLGQEYDAAPPR